MTNETTASQPSDMQLELEACREKLREALGTIVMLKHERAQPAAASAKRLTEQQIKELAVKHTYNSTFDVNYGFDPHGLDAFALEIMDNFRAPAAQASATIQAAPTDRNAVLELAASTIELFDDATMKADYMLDSTECAGIIRALKDFAATIQEPVMVAEPVAWRIGMIVHHDKAKAELDSIHWNVPLEPLYLAAPIVSQQVESKPLYLVKFDGTEAGKEASEDAYWTFSERNRKIVYELATPIVAEPVSHELMQQLGTMRAVGAAPMVADPAGMALREFKECSGDDEPDALERLRFFCSLAMKGPDWLDSEKFFDDVAATVKAIPSEALDRAAILEEAARCVEDFQAGNGTVSFNDIALSIRSLAAPLADKTGGGE